MVRNQARKLIVVTAALVIGSYVAAAARGKIERNSSSTDIAMVSATDAAGSALPEIDRLIKATTAQIARFETSSSLDLLARLQLTRGRITGDAASYSGAREATTRSLKLGPRNAEGQSLDVEVRYANHDFTEAFDRSAAIIKLDPSQLGAQAVQGDAARELGDYRLAKTILDSLKKKAPEAPSVTVREARLAFITGNANLAEQLAINAEKQASQSGLLGSTAAFYPAFRAQLAYDRGDYSTALSKFGEALRVAPGDRVATVGFARALAARGKRTDAIKVLRALTDRYPDPAALAQLGDLLSQQGNRTEANNAYGLVTAVADLATANRQIYNRELIMFYANHNRSLPEALRLARAEIQTRKDIYGWDALAWAEYKAGHIPAAVAASAHALDFQTADANINYHAGMIAARAGNTDQAKSLLRKALSISPHFDSLQAPIAASTLKGLEHQ